jgi:multidrug transporter EmrE-like cation transporter
MARLLPSIFLALTVGFNTGASLLLKLSTSCQGTARLLLVGSSIGCHGSAFLTYYASLHSFPVSVAYPVATGGGILLIVLTAAAVLDECLTGSKALGSALVICGGILLLRS